MDTYHNKEISLRELPTGWENTGLFSQSQQYFPSFPCVFRITDGAQFCHWQQRVCFSLKTCVKKLNPHVKQSQGDKSPAREEGTVDGFGANTRKLKPKAPLPLLPCSSVRLVGSVIKMLLQFLRIKFSLSTFPSKLSLCCSPTDCLPPTLSVWKPSSHSLLFTSSLSPEFLLVPSTCKMVIFKSGLLQAQVPSLRAISLAG